MNQESLKADDESNVESNRESGIFSDLAVRQHAEPPRAEGRSIPPPPPRRSSILPVARREEEPPSEELADFAAPEVPDFDSLDDDEMLPVQVQEPSSFMRPEPSKGGARTLPPPPPPGASSPSLPGMSFPSAARPRSSSIAPGTRPVSAMVANAVAHAATTVSAPEPAEPAAQVTARDLSGTFQKLEPSRGSYAAALQGPMLMPAAKVALAHASDTYDSGLEAPTTKNQIAYGLVAAGALIMACFAWYMFDTRMVPGVVQLTTAPADAEVTFDGKTVGAVSPFIKTGVEPGAKHKLEVKKAGFRTWSQEVEVQPGQSLVFTVALPPDVPTGVPLVAPVPVAAAAVPIEAAQPIAPPDVAQVAAAEPAAMAVQEPAALAVQEPAARAASNSRLAVGSSVRRESRAAPAKSGATGTLRVSTRPWSIVTIDGKLIGNTPQMNLSLPEGSHRVQLSNPEFGIEKTVTVKIESGKTETLILNLP